jgi:hypothetical protein
VWCDGHTIGFASSTDQGNTWTPAMTVNSPPATTAVFPWVAAYNGVVDIVYYGTNAASNLDPSADWHVYLAQFNGLIFTQTQVNAAANHHGVICTDGGVVWLRDPQPARPIPSRDRPTKQQSRYHLRR